MTTDHRYPKWLNIDEVLPSEMRMRVGACNEDAQNLLDTILRFAEEWLPFMDNVDRTIDRTGRGLDGWGNYIEELIGLGIARNQVQLAVWAVSQLDYDSMPTDERFKELFEQSATPEQQVILDALVTRQPPHVRNADGGF